MNWIEANADFSACKQYRYSLTRNWDRRRPTIVFVGLNPSTADAIHDDPTIRRCLRFARERRFGNLIVVNLFAFRTTDPRLLRRVADPVGPGNDAAIRKASGDADRIVAAWGVHGHWHGRDGEVMAILGHPHCLGLTKAGAPKHPLYLPARTRLRSAPRSLAGG